MTVEKMATVLHHATIGGSAKLVLLGIANHDGDGGAWPSISTLAKYASVNRRHVQRILRQLETDGLITTFERDGITNLYRVTIECPDDCSGGSQHKKRGGDIQTTGDIQTAPGGDIQTTGGATHRPPEPLLNLNRTLLEHFEQFWEIYPRKIGKKTALTTFKNIPAKEHEIIIEAVKRFRKSKEGTTEQRFIPHPTTWLRRAGWNDEIEEQAAKINRVEADRERRQRDLHKWRTEQAEAKAEAQPIPKCLHGNLIIKCTQCAKLINQGENPETLKKEN